MNIVGIDIGGANLKLSDARGRSLSRPFPLWKQPRDLPLALANMLPADEVDAFAVTMTGELADCFRTKAAGVDRILGAVETVARGKPILVWQTAGEFVTPDEARDTPQLVAAANWHVLATYAGRFVPEGTGLLIDVGSTTTDVIPLHDGLPNSLGRTDRERLTSGELVYTGVRRTPLCAIRQCVQLGDKRIGLAAELFATTLDVFLWKNDIAEDVDDGDTANGRPATRSEAGERLARMICCDRTEVGDDEIDEMCRQFAQHQFDQIVHAVKSVVARSNEPPHSVLVSGSGEFLAERVARSHGDLQGAEVVSLTRAFGETISASACAYAAACLLTERLGPLGDA